MSAATGPLTTAHRQGEITPIALAAAVQVYKGAAAAVVTGVGFGTPLVPATANHAFVGVWGESILAASPAGTTFTQILRRGVWQFDQTGLTAANVNQKAYFSDDHTITTTPGTTFAGIICSVDANGKAWVDIESAVREISSTSNYSISAPADTTNVSGAAQVVGTLIVPKNTLKVGDVVRLTGQVMGKTRNSTDTIALTLNYGATDLASAICTLAATLAHANTNWCNFCVDLVIRTAGASGTAYATGLVANGTAGATVAGVNMASATLDTTVDQKFEIGGTFSTSNVGNVVTLNMFDIQIFRS